MQAASSSSAGGTQSLVERARREGLTDYGTASIRLTQESDRVHEEGSIAAATAKAANTVLGWIPGIK